MKMATKEEFLRLLEHVDEKLARYCSNPNLLETPIIDLDALENARLFLAKTVRAVREDRLNRERPSLDVSRLINEYYPEDVKEAIIAVNLFYRDHYKIRK